ncbi:MAG: phytoene desaturase family protein [Acidimicrobiales bacterium]
MNPDVVVAGAGHNSLITACYLAKAGLRVQVLEANPIPGGGCVTEELLLPGYGIDSCATGHTLIRTNPVLAADELGLIADYGITYVDPDPVAHVAFPDGGHFTMWLDREATIAEFGRFSKADAAAYERLLAEYDDVKHVFAQVQHTPAGLGPSLDQLLAEHPRGRVWQRRRMLSAWEVVRTEFESREAQAFLLWMAFQTNQALDVPGTGILAYSILFGRQQRSWSILLGGSGRLTDALVAYLEARGGEVRCGEPVARLLLDGGRCVGVETEAGVQYRAERAVVSSIHVSHLIDMAPHDAWPEEFEYGVRTYDLGIPGFGVYCLTDLPPVFETPDGPRTAVSAGTVGWPEDVLRLGFDLRHGRFVTDVPWLLVATPTLVDPGRAPEGGHTVKLLSQQAYEPPGGMDAWPEAKAAHAARQLEHLRRSAPSFTDDHILAMLVKAPVDFEATNRHMVHGTFHGGDRGLAQSGSGRPAPGWAAHRMPFPGLYQTGATTNPGGSITGTPGRNAARVVLGDLGIDPDAFLSPGGMMAGAARRSG